MAGATPDWQGITNNLWDTMRDIRQQIKEDREAGVRPDITCMNAHDALHQYLRFVEQDLGII